MPYMNRAGATFKYLDLTTRYQALQQIPTITQNNIKAILDDFIPEGSAYTHLSEQLAMTPYLQRRIDDIAAEFTDRNMVVTYERLSFLAQKAQYIKPSSAFAPTRGH